MGRQGSLTDQKMVFGAISGMVSSLGGSVYGIFAITQNKEAKEDLNGSFGEWGFSWGLRIRGWTLIAILGWNTSLQRLVSKPEI